MMHRLVLCFSALAIAITLTARSDSPSAPVVLAQVNDCLLDCMLVYGHCTDACRASESPYDCQRRCEDHLHNCERTCPLPPMPR